MMCFQTLVYFTLQEQIMDQSNIMIHHYLIYSLISMIMNQTFDKYKYTDDNIMFIFILTAPSRYQNQILIPFLNISVSLRSRIRYDPQGHSTTSVKRSSDWWMS